jgi:AcrR family transcriptional regulator
VPTTAGLTPARQPAPHAPGQNTPGQPSTEGTRARLLDSALSLFAINSFAGTSLQMIADTVGVTKAAVYHHFKTRDEILAGVIEPANRELTAAVEAAGDKRSPTARAEAMLTGFVDVTIRHRALIALICTDVGVTHTVGSREDVARLIERMLTLFTAHQSPPESEVNATLALTGIASAAASPMLRHLSDDAMHEHLLEAGRRILSLRRRVRQEPAR